MWRQKNRITFFLLFSTYLAGILAIGFQLVPWFIYLTPFNLILSFVLLGWNHQENKKGWWLFAATGFLIGFFIEVIGVATGKIFGHYAYGPVLGPKLWDTPLLIGINWAMLTYCAGEVSSRLFPSQKQMIIRILAGAMIPVILDIIMEPVAIAFNLWHWFGQVPPLLNYVGWFSVSLVLSDFYQRLVGPENRNQVAPWLLLLQLIFFIVLFIGK